MITKDMTIGEAIKENPEIIQVLTDEKIDYCCGGNRPLESAAEAKNIDVGSFVDLLNRQKRNPENTIDEAIELNNKDLIHYIINVHHIKELKLIEDIDEGMRKIINVHYLHHGPELADIYGTFLEIKKDMVPHFAKEEQKDFPNFLAGRPANFSDLRVEHEQVGELLETLSEKTGEYTAPQDGCATYQHTFKLMKDFEEDVHKHIFLENSVLFLREN